MAKKKNRKSKMPQCDHMNELHCVYLTTVEVLSVVSAATHGVRHGYSDDDVSLEGGVNALLNQANIDCEWEDDGTMVLTYTPQCCAAGGE
jgi:hypothetical protein